MDMVASRRKPMRGNESHAKAPSRKGRGLATSLRLGMTERGSEEKREDRKIEGRKMLPAAAATEFVPLVGHLFVINLFVPFVRHFENRGSRGYARMNAIGAPCPSGHPRFPLRRLSFSSVSCVLWVRPVTGPSGTRRRSAASLLRAGSPAAIPEFRGPGGWK